LQRPEDSAAAAGRRGGGPGIGARVALLVSALVVGTTAVVGLYTWQRLSHVVVAGELEDLESAAALAALNLDAELAGLRDDARYLTSVPSLIDLVRADGGSEESEMERL